VHLAREAAKDHAVFARSQALAAERGLRFEVESASGEPNVVPTDAPANNNGSNSGSAG
jgi:hypothetical protein